MYLFYSIVLGLGLVFTAPWWLIQMARHGKYRAGLRERFGGVPARLALPADGAGANQIKTVWLHAVSVGEVLAVSRLVEELRKDFDAVYISTTTLTGQTLARERFGEQFVFYFPLDFAFAVRAYLRALRPQLVVLAETEFWPNFLRLAKASGAKVAVVNARISDRSLPGYRRSGWLIRTPLRNVDLFLAQTEEDAARLRAIGVPGEKVKVSGNLKFDAEPPQRLPMVDELRAAIERGKAYPVIVAGSTMEGEEEQLLKAFQWVMGERGLLIFAPRRPERFDAVAQLVKDRNFAVWRRSSTDLGNVALARGVLLLDTVGELAAVYELATVAFVGGSLYYPGGGHNILEPAQFAVPVIVGARTQNFRDIVEVFRRARAVRQLPADLEGTAHHDLQFLLDDVTLTPDEWKAMGARGKAIVEAQRGATVRTRDALRALLHPGAPRVEARATKEVRA